VLDNIISYDLSNIRETLEELPRDVFYKAVQDIVDARRVYILGSGSCRALAMFAAYYMKLMLIDVQLIYGGSETEIFEDMLHIDSNDIVIGFSYPRYSSKSVKAIHFAHSRNAKIIAITDSEISPIAEYATHLLLAHSDMATIVDSLVAPLSIVNALIVALSLKKREAITNELSELEKLWEEYEVYEKIHE
jgi:DNA-binding MurR/RpiR family transcriptional regulator